MAQKFTPETGLTQVIEQTKYVLASSTDAVRKFAAKVANPAEALHALYWGEEVLDAAARVEVFTAYLSFLDTSERDAAGKIDICIKQLRAHVMQHAKYPPRSSSDLANLALHAKQKAHAELLERFEYVINLIQKENS